MTSTIIPTRLHRVKTFESHEAFEPAGDGRKRVPAACDPPIERQIDQWVDETKNLIVSTGQVNIIPTTRGDLIVETRTLAVLYVPAVEQSNVKYPGEPGAGSVQPVAERREPAGTSPGQRERGAGGGAGGSLRLPPVP